MDRFLTVATYDSLSAAQLAQLQLIDEGIQATLDDANLVATYTFLSLAVGGIKLRVSQADFDRAAAVLSEMNQRRSVIDSESSERIRFRCSECGAVLEFPSSRREGVETCKECGEYIDVPSCSDATLLAADDARLVEPPVPTTFDSPATASARAVPLPVEIVAVLSFAYFPNVVYALPYFGGESDGAAVDMMRLFVHSLGSIVPVLLILALCGEGWQKFGIVPFRWILDCSLAFAVWFASNVADMFVYIPFAMPESGLTEAAPYLTSWQAVVCCLLGLTANSLAEELVMRGYLITRLDELWRSPWAAVAISAILFGSYHAYQGWWGAVAAGIMGLVYGLFFIWQRRLWPLVIAHTFHNALFYF